MKDLPACLH